MLFNPYFAGCLTFKIGSSAASGRYTTISSGNSILVLSCPFKVTYMSATLKVLVGSSKHFFVKP